MAAYSCNICHLDEEGEQYAPFTLPCTHQYHLVCIGQWFRIRDHGGLARICPVCRADVEGLVLPHVVLPPFVNPAVGQCLWCEEAIDQGHEAVTHCGHMYHVGCLQNRVEHRMNRFRFPLCPECDTMLMFTPLWEHEGANPAEDVADSWLLTFTQGGNPNVIHFDDPHINGHYDPRLRCTQCRVLKYYNEFPSPPCAPVCVSCLPPPMAPAPPSPPVDDDDASTEAETVSTRILVL